VIVKMSFFKCNEICSIYLFQEISPFDYGDRWAMDFFSRRLLAHSFA